MPVRSIRVTHHPKHSRAAGAQEPPDQTSGNQQENDVQDGRVVPLDRGCQYLGVAAGRDEVKQREEAFYQITGYHYSCVERSEQETGHSPTVIFGVDANDWEDDEICKNEADDAAETDAAIP